MSDLYDDIIVKIKFEPLTRAEQYAQLDRLAPDVALREALAELLEVHTGQQFDASKDTIGDALIRYFERNTKAIAAARAALSAPTEPPPVHLGPLPPAYMQYLEYNAAPPPAGFPTLESIRGAVARGWCAPANSCKEMDSDLALAIADEVASLFDQADFRAGSVKYDDVLVPFVALMRAELHVNSGKGDRPGWLSMNREVVMLEIYYHAAKLQKAVRDDDADRIREYAADVANMAMMILDVCGVLLNTPQDKP